MSDQDQHPRHGSRREFFAHLTDSTPGADLRGPITAYLSHLVPGAGETRLPDDAAFSVQFRVPESVTAEDLKGLFAWFRGSLTDEAAETWFAQWQDERLKSALRPSGERSSYIDGRTGLPELVPLYFVVGTIAGVEVRFVANRQDWEPPFDWLDFRYYHEGVIGVNSPDYLRERFDLTEAETAMHLLRERFPEIDGLRLVAEELPVMDNLGWTDQGEVTAIAPANEGEVGFPFPVVAVTLPSGNREEERRRKSRVRRFFTR